MKHIKLLLLLVVIAAGALTQMTQAVSEIDSCRTELRWDAAAAEYKVSCTGGCESSSFEVVVFDDPAFGVMTVTLEAADCEEEELTNHNGEYTTCSCLGTDGSGETSCCHLVDFGGGTFGVIGDCTSCPLTGVCQLYEGPNGGQPQSHCGPPPPPADDDDDDTLNNQGDL